MWGGGFWARGPLPCPTHHGDLEAHPLRAQQVLLGDAAVFENEVGGGGSPDAQLVLLLAQREARARHGHQEGADALQGTAAFPSGSPEAPKPQLTFSAQQDLEKRGGCSFPSSHGSQAGGAALKEGRPLGFWSQGPPRPLSSSSHPPKIRTSSVTPSFGCPMATVVSSSASRPDSAVPGPAPRPPRRRFPGPFLPLQRPPACPARPRTEPTLCFRALSVVAKTTAAEASQALVIQALVPFSTHSSPTS